MQYFFLKSCFDLFRFKKFDFLYKQIKLHIGYSRRKSIGIKIYFKFMSIQMLKLCKFISYI